MPRLNVSVTEQLDEALSELSERQSIPKSQLIRRSIALLKFLEDERERGLKVTLSDENDRVVKEIVPT